MMKSLLDACSEAAPAIANHLWQSTLFAAAMGALTLAFRKNQARIRFGLWLAASLKFLIPFSLLITVGSMAGRPRATAMAQPSFYAAIAQAGQPFTGTAPAAQARAQRPNLLPMLPASLAAIWACGFVVVGGLWGLRARRVSALMQDAQTLVEGREMEALRELEEASGVRKPLPLVVSRGSMEPGVFGIVRPVLIWPEGISEHLPDPHLRSILAHELWHVRRRDNLAAALHMLVEAAFWFHPLVWWIGARMVDERERACDEQVLHLGNQPVQVLRGSAAGLRLRRGGIKFEKEDREDHEQAIGKQTRHGRQAGACCNRGGCHRRAGGIRRLQLSTSSRAGSASRHRGHSSIGRGFSQAKHIGR
jgi:beta-lactamase regulating signal transducer with metallopeptidase domain